MFTAIKLFFTGLPFKKIALWAIGILLITNALSVALMYKAKADAKTWESNYTLLTEKVKIETEMRIANNLRKAKADAVKKEKADAEHLATLIKLKAENQKQRDQLKSELETAREKLELFTHQLNAAYDRVRIETSGNSLARSETASEAEYSSTTPECDGITAYGAAIERACAVTTADFNRASQWIEDVCDVHGCGE